MLVHAPPYDSEISLVGNMWCKDSNNAAIAKDERKVSIGELVDAIRKQD